MYRRTPKAFLALCDESADSNTAIEFPPGEINVSFFKQRLLKDTSPALSEPDYERVRSLVLTLSFTNRSTDWVYTH